MSFCIYCCAFQLIVLVIYPLVQTYQSLKSLEKQKLWINFWIIVTGIHLIEISTFGYLYCIPGYEFLKAICALWLYHSKTEGSIVIAELIQPIYKKLETTLAPFSDKFELVEKVK